MSVKPKKPNLSRVCRASRSEKYACVCGDADRILGDTYMRNLLMSKDYKFVPSAIIILIIKEEEQQQQKQQINPSGQERERES